MVEAYRIAVGLVLDSNISSALRTIIGQFSAADEAARKLQATLAEITGMSFAGISAGVDEMTVGLSAASRRLGTISRRLATISAQVSATAASAAGAGKSLGTAISGIGGPTAGVLAATAAGGGRGGGHGGGGGGHLHGRAAAGPVGGYFGLSPLEAAGLVVGFGALEGVKAAASEQLSEFYTVLASGMQPDSPQGREFTKRIRDVAERASVGTIFSRLDIEKLMPGIAGMAAVPLGEALPFMPSAIRFGEVMRQLGAQQGQNYSPEEAAAAAIRMSHLMGITDPSKMMRTLNLMAPAVMTARESPEQLTKILSYMVGASQGLGLSQQEIVNLAALSSVYIPGTRAGTSVNMMLQSLMPKGGIGAGTKIHKKEAERITELTKMGLIDPKTQQLFRDAQGGILLPFLQHLGAYQAAHPNEAYGQYLAIGGGERGARALEALGQPKVVQQLTEILTRQQSFAQMGGVTGVQTQLNATLANQAMRSWSDLKTIVLDMAQSTVPGLTAAFKGLNMVLEPIRDFLGKHTDIAAAAGYAAAFVGITAALKTAAGLLGIVGRIAGMGSAVTVLGGVASGLATIIAVGGAFAGAFSLITDAEKRAKATGESLPRAMAEKLLLPQWLQDLIKPNGAGAAAAIAPAPKPTPIAPSGPGMFERFGNWLWNNFAIIPPAQGAELNKSVLPAAGATTPPELASTMAYLKYTAAQGKTKSDGLSKYLGGIMPPERGAASMMKGRGVRIPQFGAASVPSTAGGAEMASTMQVLQHAAEAFIAAAVKPVHLSGDVTLNGNVMLNAPGMMEALGHLIARGIAQAAGSLSGAPARPDLSRALVGPT